MGNVHRIVQLQPRGCVRGDGAVVRIRPGHYNAVKDIFAAKVGMPLSYASFVATMPVRIAGYVVNTADKLIFESNEHWIVVQSGGRHCSFEDIESWTALAPCIDDFRVIWCIQGYAYHDICVSGGTLSERELSSAEFQDLEEAHDERHGEPTNIEIPPNDCDE